MKLLNKILLISCIVPMFITSCGIHKNSEKEIKYTVDFYAYIESNEGMVPTTCWKVFSYTNIKPLSKIEKPKLTDFTIPTEAPITLEQLSNAYWTLYDKDGFCEGAWMFDVFLVSDNISLYSCCDV